MADNVLAVFESLADHPTNESEELQVVWVHVRLSARVEGGSIAAQVEKGVIGLEHLLRKLNEKVSDQATCVNTSFSLKRNVKRLLDLSGRHSVDLIEGIHEDFLAVNFDSLIAFSGVPFSQLLDEVRSLVFEIQKVRHVFNNLI